MRRELDDYERANLGWLLRAVQRHFPQADTGDWFCQLLYLCEGAGGANVTDAEADRIFTAPPRSRP